MHQDAVTIALRSWYVHNATASLTKKCIYKSSQCTADVFRRISPVVFTEITLLFIDAPMCTNPDPLCLYRSITHGDNWLLVSTDLLSELQRGADNTVTIADNVTSDNVTADKNVAAVVPTASHSLHGLQWDTPGRWSRLCRHLASIAVKSLTGRGVIELTRSAIFRQKLAEPVQKC